MLCCRSRCCYRVSMSNGVRVPDVSDGISRCDPNELSMLFPTTLLRRMMPDAKSKNRRIRKIVLDREKSDPGVHQSNVGGWHSTADLWEWPNPEIRDLCGWVRNAV